MGRLQDGVRAVFRAEWVARGRFGPMVGRDDVRVGVVVLSLNRAGNIDPIVRAAGRCRSVTRIVVSNNDVHASANDFVTWRDPRLVLIDEPELKPVGVRWELAREIADDCDLIVSIDDDIFMSPRQLARLVDAAIADTQSVHGIAGQIGPEYVKDRETEVDYIIRTYALAPSMIERYDRLRTLMPVHGPMIERNGEDIVMSLAAPGPPKVHAVGRVLSCHTSQEPGVALSLEDPEFDAVRRAILAEARGARHALED